MRAIVRHIVIQNCVQIGPGRDHVVRPRRWRVPCPRDAKHRCTDGVPHVFAALYRGVMYGEPRIPPRFLVDREFAHRGPLTEISCWQ